MRGVERAGMLRVQLMELDALLLHGRVAVASGASRKRGLRTLARYARRLEGLDGRLARAAACHLRAIEAKVSGDERSARRLYREAAERFADAEADMWSLVARRLADPEDTAAVDAQIRERGVVDPAKWSRLFGV